MESEGTSNSFEVSMGAQRENFRNEVVLYQYQPQLLCAISVLNFVLQQPYFKKEHMEDGMVEIRSETEMQRMHHLGSKRGNYDMSVLIAVARKVGIVVTHLQEEDVFNLLCRNTGSPAYIVLNKEDSTGIGVPIRFINGYYWKLDSLERWPEKLDRMDVIQILMQFEDERFTVLKAEFGTDFYDWLDDQQFHSPHVSQDNPVESNDNVFWWSTQFLDTFSTEEVNVTVRYDDQDVELSLEATATLEGLLDQFILTIGAQPAKKKRKTAKDFRGEFQVIIGGKTISYQRLGHIPVEFIRSRADVVISRE